MVHVGLSNQFFPCVHRDRTVNHIRDPHGMTSFVGLGSIVKTASLSLSSGAVCSLKSEKRIVGTIFLAVMQPVV